MRIGVAGYLMFLLRAMQPSGRREVRIGGLEPNGQTVSQADGSWKNYVVGLADGSGDGEAGVCHSGSTNPLRIERKPLAIVCLQRPLAIGLAAV